MSIPAEIHNQKYVSLTTFRRSGVAVNTPVWLGERDGQLYVVTEKISGKSKRIRNNPSVRVAPCTIRGKITGPEFSGRAQVLPESDESSITRQIICKKYWLTRLSFHPQKNKYLKIEIAD